MTGSTIQECQKALKEAGSDINKAIKYLKEQGILKAEKKLSKEANEGAIGVMVSPDRKSSTLIEVKQI